jgi:predicted small metal-binding protein
MPCLASALTRRDDDWAGWEGGMALRIVCVCGYVIQGENEDEFWRNAQSHMRVLHPELVESVTREDLLAQAELL